MTGMPSSTTGTRKFQLTEASSGRAALLRRQAPFASLLFLLLAMAGSAPAQEAEIEFFEKKIRPVLVERCYKCHSADSKKVKGKLLLDPGRVCSREENPGQPSSRENLKRAC